MLPQDKRINWKHGKFVKIFTAFILEIYQNIEDSQFTQGIMFDERPLSQILIEETSKDIITHYSLSAKKIFINKRRKPSKKKGIQFKDERNVKLIYLSLLKFKGFLRYMSYQGISNQDVRNSSCYLKHNFYKKGTYIMRKYDKSDALYGIITGKCSIRDIYPNDTYKKFYMDTIRGNFNEEDYRKINDIPDDIFMSDLEEESESDDEDYIKKMKKRNLEFEYLENSNFKNIKKNDDNNIKKSNKINLRRVKKRGSVINTSKLNLSPIIKKKSYEIDEKELIRRARMDKLRENFLSKLTEEQIDDIIEDKIFTTRRKSITKISIIKKMNEENTKKKKKKEKKIIKPITKNQSPNDLQSNILSLHDFILDFEEENLILKEGMCFGEWGCVYNIPRTTSIYCLEDTNIFYLEKKYFDKLLYPKFSAADIKKVHFILSKFPFLKKDLKFRHLLTKITPEFFDSGDIVYTPFDDAKIIYLLYRGEASLVQLPYNPNCKDDYLNRKNDLKTILDFREGGISGLEASQRNGKYEHCLIVRKDFTIFLKMNVDFIIRKYLTFKESIKELYLQHKIVIKNFEERKKEMNKILDMKQRKNEEEDIKRPYSGFNTKHNLSNIVTKINLSSYLNDKTHNYSIDKMFKKKEKKNIISLKLDIKNNNKLSYRNHNNHHYHYNITNNTNTNINTNTNTNINTNTNTNTNSNNITQRFFLTSTPNINYPNYNNKNVNDTYLDYEENIFPLIKKQKKKKEINFYIKKINKTKFIKQLGLPSPIKHFKKINGKSIFNTGKYEIPFLSNID